MIMKKNSYKLQHIFIIPDGHRRYSEKTGVNLGRAYLKAAATLRKCIKWTLLDNEIDEFSFFSFSHSNLMKREKKNLSFIYSAIEDVLQRLIENRFLCDNEIKFRAVGEKRRWPEKIDELVSRLETDTENFYKKRFNLLFCYSGIKDLEMAIKKTTKRREKLEYENLLRNSDVPKPIDFIVRSANEKRISDGPLLPIRYAEFGYTRRLFPELRKKDIDSLVAEFLNRRRTYGG